MSNVFHIVCKETFIPSDWSSHSVFNHYIKYFFNCLDFTGPIISTNDAFPLPAGSDVEFVCKVKTTVKIISLKWSCLGKENIHQVTGSTEYASLMLYKLRFRHDNQICNCFANVDGIEKKASIQINISSKYTL